MSPESAVIHYFAGTPSDVGGFKFAVFGDHRKLLFPVSVFEEQGDAVRDFGSVEIAYFAEHELYRWSRRCAMIPYDREASRGGFFATGFVIPVDRGTQTELFNAIALAEGRWEREIEEFEDGPKYPVNYDFASAVSRGVGRSRWSQRLAQTYRSGCVLSRAVLAKPKGSYALTVTEGGQNESELRRLPFVVDDLHEGLYEDLVASVEKAQSKADALDEIHSRIEHVSRLALEFSESMSFADKLLQRWKADHDCRELDPRSTVLTDPEDLGREADSSDRMPCPQLIEDSHNSSLPIRAAVAIAALAIFFLFIVVLVLLWKR